MWKPIDWIADQIQNRIDLVVQERLAVLAIIASLLLVPYGFFSGEPLLIYLMSAVAITFTGITWLTSLVAAKKAEEAKES
jgi:type III secretory pathway component EscV